MKSSVRARRSSVSQPACRNSSAIARPGGARPALQVACASRFGTNHFGIWKQHVCELPRRPERRERGVKPLPYLVDDVGGQLARVDAPLQAERARDLRLQVLRQAERLDRVLRERGVRLHAHREVGGVRSAQASALASDGSA
jgi:hypothetical protein